MDHYVERSTMCQFFFYYNMKNVSGCGPSSAARKCSVTILCIVDEGP